MTVFLAIGALAAAAPRKVMELSGVNPGRCMQCGTCTSVCPMVEAMDVTVRQTMLLLQHGRAEELAAARTGAVCAACHNCEVRCPRGIEIPRLMEALRLLELRKNRDLVDPRAIPRERLAALPPIAMVAAFRELTA
ncbi:MAG: 4Fe-4S dicluster domain-containing protein [Planctomycetota bacterium]